MDKTEILEELARLRERHGSDQVNEDFQLAEDLWLNEHDAETCVSAAYDFLTAAQRLADAQDAYREAIELFEKALQAT